MKYTQTNKHTHTYKHPVKTVMSIRSDLPDQISFVVHRDEAVHIKQAFIIVNLNEITATIHRQL